MWVRLNRLGLDSALVVINPIFKFFSSIIEQLSWPGLRPQRSSYQHVPVGFLRVRRATNGMTVAAIPPVSPLAIQQLRLVHLIVVCVCARVCVCVCVCVSAVADHTQRLKDNCIANLRPHAPFESNVRVQEPMRSARTSLRVVCVLTHSPRPPHRVRTAQVPQCGVRVGDVPPCDNGVTVVSA